MGYSKLPQLKTYSAIKDVNTVVIGYKTIKFNISIRCIQDELLFDIFSEVLNSLAKSAPQHIKNTYDFFSSSSAPTKIGRKLECSPLKINYTNHAR